MGDSLVIRKNGDSSKSAEEREVAGIIYRGMYSGSYVRNNMVICYNDHTFQAISLGTYKSSWSSFEDNYCYSGGFEEDYSNKKLYLTYTDGTVFTIEQGSRSICIGSFYLNISDSYIKGGVGTWAFGE